jgi:hypothetical protein
MPLAMSTELVNHMQRLLIEKEVPSAVVDEVIEILRAEVSKEDAADTAKAKLQQIADNLARRTLGASANPDRIANQAREYYNILIPALAGGVAGEVVLGGNSIIEKVAGGLGEAVKAFRDLFKDSARRPGGRGRVSVGPADNNHPTQPSGHHTSGKGHHISGHHPTRPAYRDCCSFCGKGNHEVRKLVAGPRAFICEECIVSFTQRLTLGRRQIVASIHRITPITHGSCCSFCGSSNIHFFCGSNQPNVGLPPVFICFNCLNAARRQCPIE